MKGGGEAELTGCRLRGHSGAGVVVQVADERVNPRQASL